MAGRAQYTDDLCPRNALVAKVLHSTIANGWVKAWTPQRRSAARVVKVLTCFDVPEIQYPPPATPGRGPAHPGRGRPEACSTGGCASMETVLIAPWWRVDEITRPGRWGGSGRV